VDVGDNNEAYEQYDSSDEGKLWAATQNIEGSGHTSSETYLDAQLKATAGGFNLFNLMTRNPISIYSTNSIFKPPRFTPPENTNNKKVILVDKPAFVGLNHPDPKKATHALFVLQYSPNAGAETSRQSQTSKRASTAPAAASGITLNNFRRFKNIEPGHELEIRWFYKWNAFPAEAAAEAKAPSKATVAAIAAAAAAKAAAEAIGIDSDVSDDDTDDDEQPPKPKRARSATSFTDRAILNK